MGENVQINMEMMAPDITELKACNFFKDAEISHLVKTRRHFDYKINGITKRLPDFKAAIQFERSLLLELMKRRKAKNLRLKKQTIDFSVIKRIQSIYSSAMVIFSDNYDLHVEYYNFFKQYLSFHTIVTEHVSKMIQKFESNTEVFRVAASWFYQTVSTKEAIRILLRGLARHPLCEEMYVDVIELELKEADEQRLNDKLMKYVDDILKHVHRHEFLIEILDLLEPHPHLKNVHNYIIDNLLEKYWFEEDVWHVIALRELKGLYYKASPEEVENKSTRKSIKRCIARYKEGIAKLPSRKQPGLWKLYLTTVIDLQKQNPDAAVVLKADTLRQALDDAKKANVKLDETHWAAWIDACESNDELLVQKLGEGTREHPQSATLWCLYLKYYILKDKAALSEQIFRRAVKALGPRALSIWEIYIDYHFLKSPSAEVNELYKKAVSQPYEQISKVFKPRYLVWSVLSYGLDSSRKIYWDMADKPPYCKELHEEMLQIELMEHYRSDVNNRMNVIALYAKQFGHQEVDVWIRWISLIREHRSMDRNEKEREVFDQAIKALPDRLANDFREKFDALA